jgi:hypothetical protein
MLLQYQSNDLDLLRLVPELGPRKHLLHYLSLIHCALFLAESRCNLAVVWAKKPIVQGYNIQLGIELFWSSLPCLYLDLYLGLCLASDLVIRNLTVKAFFHLS